MKIRNYKVHVYREVSPQINLRVKARYSKKFHLDLVNSNGFTSSHVSSKKMKDLSLHLVNILMSEHNNNGDMIIYNISYEPRGAATRGITEDEYSHFHRHLENKLEGKEIFLLNCLGRLLAR